MEKLYKHPWLIVAVIVLITIFFAFQLPRAELDNNNLRFVPPDDPALETTHWIDGMFGSSLFILVGLQRHEGTIFDPDFINRIQEYEWYLEGIPIVREVVSLISADYITSIDDAIVAENLLGYDFSGSPEEIAELQRRLLSWDMYERALFSDDFTATQILIPLSISTDEAGKREVTEYFTQIRDTAQETFADIATVYVTGMPIISATVNEAMNADLKLLVPLVILVVLLVLFFSFRGFTPVVLPLLVVLVAVIWTIGAMPIFGITLSVISTVLPVILVAVGSTESIHIITHYLHDRGTAAMSREEHQRAVFAVIRKMRKSVFLTAITTLVGFSSFCFTSVVPVREFGYFSSFGVLVAFLITMALVPTLLIIRGPKRMKARTTKTADSGIAVIADTLVGITRRKKTILGLVAIMMIISAFGVSRLVVDNVFVEYFRPTTDIYRSDGFIRDQFGGSKVVSLVIEADSFETILSPDTLAAMDGLSSFLQNEIPAVGKVMSFTDLVKRINQVFNITEDDDGSSWYEIPVDPQRYGKESPDELVQLVSNYLLLLSGNIDSYANDPLEPTAIKSTIQLRTLGMADSEAVFREIENYIDNNFPAGLDVTLGGVTMVEGSLNNLVVQSQLVSVLISIIAIFIIMTISNRSLVAGIISIIPLSISVLINFAIMGFAGIKLNIGTSMVAAVSICVGIDYAIHCIEAYKREYRASNGEGDYLRHAFLSSGKAIIINAVSVGAGFAVLLFSSFVMLEDLGLLIAIAMFSSALVSLTVLPVLLIMLKPKFVTNMPLQAVQENRGK